MVESLLVTIKFFFVVNMIVCVPEGDSCTKSSGPAQALGIFDNNSSLTSSGKSPVLPNMSISCRAQVPSEDHYFIRLLILHTNHFSMTVDLVILCMFIWCS